MATSTDPIARLHDAIGVRRGPSSWRTVTQEDIDAFARITGDHQWIHVDVDRAQRESPFGTTIAHGNLTLSLIDGLREQLSADDAIEPEGIALGVNMGWNRVRFPSPVPAGAKIRASAELVSVEAKNGGWWEVVDRFTVEVDGAEKPACVAESVGRILPTGGG
ncbi:MAG TPA: MaoC family dehydratase [Solirubrobacteraceae bacterium]|nr:MaoC family dehydratase [Solirubrobacteraceae bacterium]